MVKTRLYKLSKRPFDAVCFDMDGVLVHTMPLHAQAWQEALKKWGLQVLRREIYQWEGEPGFVTAKRLLRRQGKGSNSNESCEQKEA